jgi:hypothetical protein
MAGLGAASLTPRKMLQELPEWHRLLLFYFIFICLYIYFGGAGV